MRDESLAALIWLLISILCYSVFAYDIENDRDYITWLWLMMGNIGLIYTLRYLIQEDRDNTK